LKWTEEDLSGPTPHSGTDSAIRSLSWFNVRFSKGSRDNTERAIPVITFEDGIV
jgi:hypothetical protein